MGVGGLRRGLRHASQAAGGTLGSVDGFATAVGDPSKAMYGFFINLDLFEKSYADSFRTVEGLRPPALKSVGGSSTMSAATEGTFQSGCSATDSTDTAWAPVATRCRWPWQAEGSDVPDP